VKASLGPVKKRRGNRNSIPGFSSGKTGSTHRNILWTKKDYRFQLLTRIENAIKELQALTGIPVKCLDDDGAVKNHAAISRNPPTENENASAALYGSLRAPGRKS
jgi:hypothetical protein